MNASDFTENHEIIYIVDDLKETFDNKIGRKLEVSDVIDDQEHQYVDLVQEGGGVLGIALLGYTYILEQMGIRFLSLGGTSAGAINTLLMAACDSPENEKTVKILELIANKNLYDFVDGDSDSREFIKTILNKKVSALKLFWKGGQIIDNFRRDLALNPGDNFHKWLTETINNFGISNTEVLKKRINDLPESIRFRKDENGNSLHGDRDIKSKLAIIAAELNTETKIKFPEMAELFYEDCVNNNPADFVRASMSIPLFFKPFMIENLPDEKETILYWKRWAQHLGGVPKRAVFVDGGVMSNFPIDVFHNKGQIPSRPTFGVKLGLDRVKNNDITNIGALLFGCFDSARNLRDFEFIKENNDFKRLVSCIDTGDHNWLNFDVSDQMKLDLFVAGAKEAKIFLENFDWQDYKKLRGSVQVAYPAKTIENFEELIDNIISDKDQQVLGEAVTNLKNRLTTIDKPMKLRALWVDDKSEEVIPERELLTLLGIDIVLINSTKEAKNYIDNNDKVQLVLSDMKRENDGSEGMNFTQWLYNKYPFYNRKVIYYITDIDLSRGSPAYALGITSSVVELIHLVIDLWEREYQFKSV